MCYRGDEEYKSRMIRIKVSLEMLMTPYYPARDFREWFGEYDK